MDAKENKETHVSKHKTASAPISENKSRINPWMVATVLLAVVLIVVIVYARGGFGASGTTVSANDAATKVVTYINANPQLTEKVELSKVAQEGQLYRIDLKYQGREVPVYATLDGKYLVNPISLEQNPNTDTTTDNTPQEIPKTDKPKVDLYVFSYCPYGLQAEKALFPVYTLLKDKADINIVAIGAMHGEYEKQESLRQLCIQKEYGKDKLMAYLEKFDTNTSIGSCQGSDTCLAPLKQAIYTQLGIDKAKIENCVTKDAEALYNADTKQSSDLGISSSPTLVINGVEAQVARNPEAIKTAICGAFNTAPSECSQTLSTTGASAGFGASAGASTGATC